MGDNNYPTPFTLDELMSQSERRLAKVERRVNIRTAADILGPGYGPYAVEVGDFNAENARFSGVFFANPGAANTPDEDKLWVMRTLSTSEGVGVQVAYTARAVDGGFSQWSRSFYRLPGSIEYTAWTEGGGGTSLEAPPGYSPPSAQWLATKGYVDDSLAAALLIVAEAYGPQPRVSLAPYLTWGSMGTRFDILRMGVTREIRGAVQGNLPTGTTTITTPIDAQDRPQYNSFAFCYLAGGNPGVAFIRSNGEIAMTNMSGASRNGNHQFTIIYTIEMP